MLYFVIINSIFLNLSGAKNMTKICLPQQNICGDKIVFVANKTFVVLSRVLSRQAEFCRDKQNFVATKDAFCRDKNVFVAIKDVFCRDKNVFVATKICLSQQKFCRDKHTFVATKDNCGSSRQ